MLISLINITYNIIRPCRAIASDSTWRHSLYAIFLGIGLCDWITLASEKWRITNQTTYRKWRIRRLEDRARAANKTTDTTCGRLYFPPFLLYSSFKLSFFICINGTYIYRLCNNLFIHTTCFDPNGSSSCAFSYTSLVIELQRNIRTFTLTYIGHNRSLPFSSYTFGDVTQW
jgi:hypothetical protein